MSVNADFLTDVKCVSKKWTTLPTPIVRRMNMKFSPVPYIYVLIKRCYHVNRIVITRRRAFAPVMQALTKPMRYRRISIYYYSKLPEKQSSILPQKINILVKKTPMVNASDIVAKLHAVMGNIYPKQ